MGDKGTRGQGDAGIGERGSEETGERVKNGEEGAQGQWHAGIGEMRERRNGGASKEWRGREGAVMAVSYQEFGNAN